MRDSWDFKHNLDDSIKAGQRFVGKRVRVMGGGMIVEGILVALTPKREAVVKTAKNGVQGISPCEEIVMLA